MEPAEVKEYVADGQQGRKIRLDVPRDEAFSMEISKLARRFYFLFDLVLHHSRPRLGNLARARGILSFILTLPRRQHPISLLFHQRRVMGLSPPHESHQSQPRPFVSPLDLELPTGL